MLHQYLPIHTLRALSRFAGLLVALWLAGCAAPFNPDDALSDDIPTRANVSGVPLIQQAAFYCGPTSIAMVMQWAGTVISPEEVAEISFTPGAGGTFLADMTGSARRLGQLAVQIDTLDALLQEVAAGHPVIVFQNLGFAMFPIWHYGVVTGYDVARDEVYLNSGQRDQMVLSFGMFEGSWARGDYWALVILPPDQLPTTSRQRDILSAAAALERVGQFDAAETLYETGAAEWPGNWLWYFGLGNARYAQGDLRGARQALLEARRVDPTIPEIGANLSKVEAEL